MSSPDGLPEFRQPVGLFFLYIIKAYFAGVQAFIVMA